MVNPLLNRTIDTSNPFVGHSGVGSRISFFLKMDIWVLRESARSQLILLFSLGLLTFFPAYILVFKQDEINGGLIGKSVLGLTSLFLFPFFVKYFRRFLGKRRIEIQPKSQKILFIKEDRDIKFSIGFNEVSKIEIKKITETRSRHHNETYTLIVTNRTGQIYELCTTDAEAEMKKIYLKIAELLNIPDGSLAKN